MSKDDVRPALTAILGELMDPKYHPHPARYEAEMKAAVRERWADREHFPPYFETYIQKWSKA